MHSKKVAQVLWAVQQPASALAIGLVLVAAQPRARCRSDPVHKAWSSGVGVEPIGMGQRLGTRLGDHDLGCRAPVVERERALSMSRNDVTLSKSLRPDPRPVAFGMGV